MVKLVFFNALSSFGLGGCSSQTRLSNSDAAMFATCTFAKSSAIATEASSVRADLLKFSVSPSKFWIAAPAWRQSVPPRGSGRVQCSIRDPPATRAMVLTVSKPEWQYAEGVG